MEALSDLNTFASLLTDKGYTGYFHTQGAYAGKLRDSISDYLQNCRNGVEGMPKPVLLVTGYLQWSGDDKPRVECSMWIKYQHGKFDLQKMQVMRKDCFGQLMKQSELTNLSAIAAPKASEAIALVSETPEPKHNNSRRFRL